ncbi:MAG: hypothetical protein HYX90_08050 [Chloroflexi bacterium]|nr:hypothetical protein [Chloroflexota bacterium]
MELRNKKWNDQQFNEYLEKVRSWYPTGREVEFDEAVEYHRKMPERRNLVKAQARANAEGRILLCPRAGFATMEQTLETHLYARDNGGSDYARISTDAYTRRMEFDKAMAGLEESRRLGRSILNGFPSVIHGLAVNRQLHEGIDLPISTICGAAHTELHYLITLAAGATEAVGDALSHLVVDANTPLQDSLIYKQFVDRLVGFYEEKGIPIFKEHKCTGVLMPPSLRIAITIIGMLLAAEQGARNFGLKYDTYLCVVQDVAGQRVLRDLASKYLKRFRYQGTIMPGISTYSGFHPADRARCFPYFTLAAAIARWGGAGSIVTFTVDEGMGLPTKEGQVMTLKALREMLYLLRNQSYPDSKELADEYAVIEREATAIIEKIIEVGEGDIAIGSDRALKSGALDITYPCNKFALGKALSVRDGTGAVRFLDCGNLPFDREMREFNRAKVAARKQSENKKDYQLIVEDLTSRVAKSVGARSSR